MKPMDQARCRRQTHSRAGHTVSPDGSVTWMSSGPVGACASSQLAPQTLFIGTQAPLEPRTATELTAALPPVFCSTVQMCGELAAEDGARTPGEQANVTCMNCNPICLWRR